MASRGMISEPFDALVCDLDGVVYVGDDPVPGAVDAVGRLIGAGTRLLFATNNSRATVSEYVAKLDRLGIRVGPESVLTSAMVTGEELAARGHAGRTAIVVGGDGIRDALADAGIEVVGRDTAAADLVVVGWDPSFTYDDMKRAALALRAGATLIATNEDAAYPAPDGLWPGAGAILASITTAAGVEAEIMGKPHPPMMKAAARRLNGARTIAAIGDRAETDLAGARTMGWTTILVLSGVTTRAEAASLQPRPDLILDSLADLAQ